LSRNKLWILGGVFLAYILMGRLIGEGDGLS
jgi:hypothetical protein